MRARPGSEPPYASVRVFVAGDRNPRTMEECEHCSSMPSKPPSMQCPATCAVAGHDLGDLMPFHGLGDLAEHRVRHRARRPHRQPGEHRRGLPAVVVELREDRHAVVVRRRGHLLVAGDDLAVEAVDQLLVRPVGGVGRVLLGDDQADAARRACRVVVGVLLGRKAVLGVVGQVRGEHDPVADHHRPDPQRREQVPVPAGPAHRPPPVTVRVGSSGSRSAADIVIAARRASSTASRTVRGATQSPARGVPGRCRYRASSGSRCPQCTTNPQSAVRCSPVHRSSSST